MYSVVNLSRILTSAFLQIFRWMLPIKTFVSYLSKSLTNFVDCCSAVDVHHVDVLAVNLNFSSVIIIKEG